MHGSLHSYIEQLEPPQTERRQDALEALVSYVGECGTGGQIAALTFICTHNSRRSHFGQVWAAAAAAYCGVSHVRTFSGGTEVTAMNPRAIAALERAGFAVRRGSGDNPVYVVRWDEGPGLQCFSKRYDDDENPSRDFAAVMTCSEADAACPVIVGATQRIALPYDDPKASDGSPNETATYDERCREIASEMLYVMHRCK